MIVNTSYFFQHGYTSSHHLFYSISLPISCKISSFSKNTAIKNISHPKFCIWHLTHQYLRRIWSRSKNQWSKKLLEEVREKNKERRDKQEKMLEENRERKQAEKVKTENCFPSDARHSLGEIWPEWGRRSGLHWPNNSQIYRKMRRASGADRKCDLLENECNKILDNFQNKSFHTFTCFSFSNP